MHIAALASPGANMLLVSQMAASGHSDSARFAGLGVSLGAGLWATVVVLGGNVAFQVFPDLRLVLQLVGGLYLLYLAVRVWRTELATADQPPAAVARGTAFRLGLLATATNPKAALFYGVFAAMLPAEATQSLRVAAVTIIVINATLWYMGLAWFFSRQRVRAAYAGASTVASRITAICFGAFGVGLLLSAVRMARS